MIYAAVVGYGYAGRAFHSYLIGQTPHREVELAVTPEQMLSLMRVYDAAMTSAAGQEAALHRASTAARPDSAR
mgnify:CR=1 FL=1